jgi:hypothetical protein
MKLIDRVHDDYVATRRTRVCGDGLVVSSTDRFILLLDLKVQHSQRPRNRLMT